MSAEAPRRLGTGRAALGKRAFDDKGKAGGVGAVAVSAIVFLPAGFFMTGTSARLPAGTVIKGFLDEDVPVAFAGNDAPVPIVASAAISPAPATVSNAVHAPELVKVATPPSR